MKNLKFIKFLVFWLNILLFFVFFIKVNAYDFGGVIYYTNWNDNSNIYKFDLNKKTKTKINSQGSVMGVYKDIGVVYYYYDQTLQQQFYYYKSTVDGTTIQLLPQNSNLYKFNKETGEFIYSTFSNGTQNYYKSSISNNNPKLILSGKEIWIMSVSNDFSNIIYQKNDFTTIKREFFLKNTNNLNEIYLGLEQENSPNLNKFYNYRFYENNGNIILKNINSYDYTTSTSSNYSQFLDVSDFNNITYSSSGLDFGPNTWFIGKSGNDVYYRSWDSVNQIEHTYRKSGNNITEIFSGNYNIISDYQSSSVLSYNGNIFYNYRDTNLGKNIIGYYNLNTGVKTTLSTDINYWYDQIYLKEKDYQPPCISSLESCGDLFNNYEELAGFDDKQYTSKLGFIGTSYSADNLNYGNVSQIGYLSNNYSFNSIDDFSNGIVGKIGQPNISQDNFITNEDNYIGYLSGKELNIISPKINFYSQIGFLGTKNDFISKNINDYTHNFPVGFIGNSINSNYLLSFQKIIYKNKNETTSNFKKVSDKIVSKTIDVASDIGDPVSLNSGEFTYENTLLKTRGNLPYSFDLYYSNQVDYPGIVGNNFDFSYNKFLTLDENGDITYYNGKLGNYKFTKNTLGYYDYNAQLKGYLELQENGEFLLTIDNKTKLYFNDILKLSKIEDLNNNFLTFLYDFDGKLIKTKTSLGDEINYEYYYNGKIFRIYGPNNFYITFQYYSNSDLNGTLDDLESIIINNNSKITTNNFTYTKSNNNADSHNIVKLIDAENQVYVENIYENDRVISQKYGNGTITYNYLTDENNKVIQNTVINRNNDKTIYKYNSSGMTISKEVFAKNNNSVVYNYEYDNFSNLIKEIYPKGNGYKYKYDENGNLVEKRFKQNLNSSDENSDLVYTYTYDEFFNLVDSITKPDGAKVYYSYDDFGNISSKSVYDVSDISGGEYDLVTSYEYDSNGNIISYKDENDVETIFEYNQKNQVISKTTGTGSISQKESFVYDDIGNIVKKIDSLGNETLLSYDEYNLLKYLTTPEGTKTYFTYDNLGNKTSEKLILDDINVVEKQYSYDILDNITQSKKDLGNNKSKINISTYDGNGNISSLTDENGLRNVLEYNFENKISKKYVYNSQNILVRSLSYNYDINGNLIESKDDKGNGLKYEYDLYDRLIKTFDSKTKTTSEIVYDKVGNNIETKIYSTENILLQKINYTYDEVGKVLKQDNSVIKDGEIIAINSTKFLYNKAGLITKVIYPDNNTVENEFDDLKRLVSQKDIYSKITDYTYDKRNLLTKKVIHYENSDQIYTYEYDKDGRLLKETNPNNKSKNYSYNKLNQIIKVINELGIETNLSYDYVGNIIKKTIKTGNSYQTTNYEYDTNNNLVKLTDPKGNITNYVYDEFSRVIKQKKQDLSEIIYEYDNYDNLVLKINPDKTQIKYIYDNLNRLIQKNIVYQNNSSDKVTKEEYEYDDLGRIIKTKDNFGNINSFTYDNDGKILSEKQNDDEVKYLYNSLGNITSKIYPNGEILSYTYDYKQRITQIKNSSKILINYTYSKDNLISEDFGNGVITTYTYDELQRKKSQVTKKDSQELKSYNYTYNDLSNIVDDGYNKYTYDELERIIGVDYKNNSKETFAYDELGNRSSKTKNNDLVNYENNNLNQITKTISGSGEVFYSYDINGNLIQDQNYKYEYDYKNRLVKVINIITNDEVRYIYDILGRRVSKETLDKKINYIYSNTDIIQEKELSKINATTTNKTYFYGKNGEDDIISQSLESSGSIDTYFYTKNAQNSVVLLTDNNGTIKEKYIYDIFGKAYKKVQNIVSNSGNINTQTGETSSGNTINQEPQTQSGSTETNSGETSSGSIQIFENTSSGATETQTNSGTTNTETETQSGIIETNSGSIDQNSYTANYIEYDGEYYQEVGEEDTKLNSKLYTSREYDSEIGLYYYRARYYDANLGKFISRDPIDIEDDINLYAYVGNNPVNNVDPSGLYAKNATIKTYDFTTDVTGLKSLGEGIGYSTLYWQGYLTNDNELQNAGIKGINTIKTDIYIQAGTTATFGVGGVALKTSTGKQAVKTIVEKSLKLKSSVINSSKYISNAVSDLKNIKVSSLDLGNGFTIPTLVKEQTKNIEESSIKMIGKSGGGISKYTLDLNKAREILRKNLGNSPSIYNGKSQAHHIIPLDLFKDEKLLKKFEDWGIDINSKENGIWLPTEKISGLSPHPSIHRGRTGSDYLKQVKNEINSATNRESALRILNELKSDLQSGTLKINNAL